ncbi:acyl-CoA dehydrogenase family protein [Streptomyces sp. NBC_00582]|uniref:acyl-CoA dehydrogenase family protein n=1 Tax=Streptomyces sp. NBC_00582 TaxID=2975783 RepID=UPI002E80C2D5|nr:acyl-CoA dehydrogenase family protein [Streptomyces sp. NBC_00582]WUB67474.1 acyl-CoA dehydrogenase family protein [Streptomyces sp. NBC_00582]
MSEQNASRSGAARGLVPLLRRNALAGEEIGALTPETLQAMHEAGVFKIMLPPELGGDALGARDTVEVIAALAEGDGAAAWTVFVSGGIRNLLGFPEQAVEEVFKEVDTWVGPLAVGASVFSPLVGAARAVDGGFLVSGKWAFGSGCKHAAWAVVGVEYEDAQGRLRRAMALLRREQYTIVDDWRVMGLKGTSSNSITVEGEVFVPEHRVLDMADLPAAMDGVRERYSGVGFRNGARALMVITCLTNVAIALGMAQGTLDCFIEQARARKPFNLPYPTVADMPSTQVSAGTARAMVNIAEAVILRHADEVDRRALAGEDFTAAEESEITMDLVYAVRLCADAVDRLQLALGSSTVSLNNPIQRFVRDIRVLATHGAIRFDPMAEISGRQVLGLEPLSMFASGLPQVG